MSPQLPDLSNPWRLVQYHKSYEGKARAESLPRLRDAVQAIVDEVAYRLQFGRDSEGRAMISGKVDARVTMECRRCMQPVELPVQSRLSLVLVASEAEAERLPDDLDLVILEDGPMRPMDLIEDELLLSLPAYPCHPGDVCLDSIRTAAGDEDRDGVTSEDNPFAVLAELKKKV